MIPVQPLFRRYSGHQQSIDSVATRVQTVKFTMSVTGPQPGGRCENISYEIFRDGGEPGQRRWRRIHKPVVGVRSLGSEHRWCVCCGPSDSSPLCKWGGSLMRVTIPVLLERWAVACSGVQCHHKSIEYRRLWAGLGLSATLAIRSNCGKLPRLCHPLGTGIHRSPGTPLASGFDGRLIRFKSAK